MSAPAPTATGTLEATPIVNLVVYAMDHRLTGTLVLEEPDHQKHAIYFHSGAPANVRTAVGWARLGEVLVELEHLTEQQRSASFAQAEVKGVLHGEAMLAAGFIDEATLREGLREQWIQKIVYLASRPAQTLYGYYDQVNFLEQWGGREQSRCKPLALIWRLIEAQAVPERIADVLARLGERPLRLHLEAPIRRFRFSRTEQAVIDVLRAKPQALSELIARDLVDRAVLERLVYALAITRQFDLGVPGAEPLGVDEAPSSSRIMSAQPFEPSMHPPAGQDAPTPGRFTPPLSFEPPEVRTFKEEIRARAARLDDSLYEVLGVAKDASALQVQSAYIDLAKRWHPDRLGPEYQDVKELASRVFSRMSEAREVLGDPTLRREYNVKLRQQGKEAAEQEQVVRVLRAATAFQKAEVFLKRNNLPAAEIEAKQALADDPDQADYLGLVAWIEMQKPNANFETLLRMLDRAIALQPNSVRARWYRGQLYKRMGKESRAIQDFRFIVEREPKHVEAQREIRIYTMRRSGPSGPSSIPPGGSSPSIRPTPPPASPEKGKGEGGGGLISKLFKR